MSVIREVYSANSEAKEQYSVTRPEHQATQAIISLAFIDAELAETRAQLSTLDSLDRAIQKLKADEGKRILNRASDHCSNQLLIASSCDALAMVDYARACLFIQDHLAAWFEKEAN